MAEYIDVTPTWAQIIEIHIMALEHSGSESAKTEIRRLATIADQYNELVKNLNHIEPQDQDHLRAIADRLGNGTKMTDDQRRDLSNAIFAILSRIEK